MEIRNGHLDTWGFGLRRSIMTFIWGNLGIWLRVVDPNLVLALCERLGFLLAILWDGRKPTASAGMIDEIHVGFIGEKFNFRQLCGFQLPFQAIFTGISMWSILKSIYPEIKIWMGGGYQTRTDLWRGRGVFWLVGLHCLDDGEKLRSITFRSLGRKKTINELKRLLFGLIRKWVLNNSAVNGHLPSEIHGLPIILI